MVRSFLIWPATFPLSVASPYTDISWNDFLSHNGDKDTSGLGDFPVVVLGERVSLGLESEVSEGNMAPRMLSDENDLRKQILRIVRKNKTCDLDEPILKCTSYNWTQVFLKVDQLSRSGELRLLCKRAGDYTVSLPRAA
jgi:hypothetical protein